MNFVSDTFIIFLILAWAVFAVVPARWRMFVLLGASYVFYSAFSVAFIFVILFSTTTDYVAGRVIHASTSIRRRRLALTLAVTINLLLLAIFKYANFFLQTQNSLLHWLGINISLPAHLDIILPLGISFYTCEAISYLIDVYRGRKPASNWLEYNFYIMYFPHLISGPIVRFNELVPQYREIINFPSADRVRRGIELIVLGYLFKLIVADNCAPFAAQLFDNPSTPSVTMAYTGSFAFATQLYFDFLGYVQIARGVSLLFNIELPRNFNQSMLASSFTDFWQRWQITLSSWLRDYLYRPLGGFSRSWVKSTVGVMVVFLVAGLWHGAGWHFIAMGAWYGALLVAHRLYRKLRKRLLKESDRAVTDHVLYRAVSVGVTYFYCAIVGGVLFRSPDMHTAITVINHLLRFNGLLQQLAEQIVSGNALPLAYLCLFPALGMMEPWFVAAYKRLSARVPALWQIPAAAAACILCWIMSSEITTPFIYFQF